MIETDSEPPTDLSSVHFMPGSGSKVMALTGQRSILVDVEQVTEGNRAQVIYVYLFCNASFRKKVVFV